MRFYRRLLSELWFRTPVVSFICLKLSASLSRRSLRFFGVKSSWLHQQVLTEATSNSCDWRLTLFALLYPRQRKLSPSMSRKIWIQIRWLLEFQVRWIPTKRSLRVLYSSVEQQLYICSVRVLVFCWLLAPRALVCSIWGYLSFSLVLVLHINSFFLQFDWKLIVWSTV